MWEWLLTCIRRAKHGQWGDTHTQQSVISTGCEFHVLSVSWSSGWSFFISAHLCLLASSIRCCASLLKSSFSDLNLFTYMSEAFTSAISTSKSLMETPGMEFRSALSTVHLCGWVMNSKRGVRSQNCPKHTLNACRGFAVKPASCWRSKCWAGSLAVHASLNSLRFSKCTKRPVSIFTMKSFTVFSNANTGSDVQSCARDSKLSGATQC